MVYLKILHQRLPGQIQKNDKKPVKISSNASGISIFSPEDGSSTFLRNVGIYLQHNTALKHRTTTSTAGQAVDQSINKLIKQMVN
jgi:hypothetical protein